MKYVSHETIAGRVHMTVEWRVWGFLWKRRAIVVRWVRELKYEGVKVWWTTNDTCEQFTNYQDRIFTCLLELALERNKELDRALAELEAVEATTDVVTAEKYRLLMPAGSDPKTVADRYRMKLERLEPGHEAKLKVARKGAA